MTLPIPTEGETALALETARVEPDGTPPEFNPLFSKWLLFALPLAMFGLIAGYLGGLSVLLPLQAEHIAGATGKVALLGAASGVGALVAAVTNPIIGWLSDHTRFRLGKRNTWVLIGSIGLVVAFSLIGHANSVVAVVAGWGVVQLFLTAQQAPLSATVADRVPIHRLGFVSGLIGAVTTASALAGVAIAALVPSIQSSYYILGGIVLVTGCVFAFTTKDVPAAARQPRISRADRVRVVVSRDFVWAWIGRFLVLLGQGAASLYLLYILQDYLHYSKIAPGQTAAQGVLFITMITSICSIASSFFFGWLSDKLKRRRIFVAISSVLVAGPYLLMAFFPSFPLFVVVAVLSGLGIGAFYAVDQALAVSVLPRKENAGTYLGILVIAGTLGQVLSPTIAAVSVGISGYPALFVVAAVVSILGAVSVTLIRSVR